MSASTSPSTEQQQQQGEGGAAPRRKRPTTTGQPRTRPSSWSQGSTSRDRPLTRKGSPTAAAEATTASSITSSNSSHDGNNDYDCNSSHDGDQASVGNKARSSNRRNRRNKPRKNPWRNLAFGDYSHNLRASASGESSPAGTTTDSNRMEDEDDPKSLAELDDYLRQRFGQGSSCEDTAARVAAIDFLQDRLVEWAATLPQHRRRASIASSSSSQHEQEQQPPNHQPQQPPASSSFPPLANPAKPRPAATHTVWNNRHRHRTQSPPPPPPPTIVPFGSYRLGVSLAEYSDLDLLVVAPSTISREDFFTHWVRYLQRLAEDSHENNKNSASVIQHIHPIPEAYTPVLRFQLWGRYDIDMLFVSLQTEAATARLAQYHSRHPNNPENGLPLVQQTPSPSWTGTPVTTTTTTTTPVVGKDHNPLPPPSSPPRTATYKITHEDLVGQDDKGLRSLNGARVSQMLLQELVPNVTNYRIVLKAVKHWAVAKGIYSNVLGFLGGINWAILVARVACFHPRGADATPAELLHAFFRTFATWAWPNPVLLNQIARRPPWEEDDKAPTDAASRRWHHLVWQPFSGRNDPAQARRYAAELMPIITPAFPAMNSAYNVGLPQFRTLHAAFRRGHALLWSSRRRRRRGGTPPWEALFAPEDDLLVGSRTSRTATDESVPTAPPPVAVDTFLQVTIGATTTKDFVVWFRYVESRLRLLLTHLDTPEMEVHPRARFYPNSGAAHPHQTLYLIGLRGAKHINLVKDTRPVVAAFLHQVNSWNKRRPDGMFIALECVDRATAQSTVAQCCSGGRAATTATAGNGDNQQAVGQDPSAGPQGMDGSHRSDHGTIYSSSSSSSSSTCSGKRGHASEAGQLTPRTAASLSYDDDDTLGSVASVVGSEGDGTIPASSTTALSSSSSSSLSHTPIPCLPDDNENDPPERDSFANTSAPAPPPPPPPKARLWSAVVLAGK